MTKITMRQHVKALMVNPKAFTHHIDTGAVTRKAKEVFAKCGYKKVPEELIKEYVDIIFDLQKNQPFFYTTVAGRPAVWNDPKKNFGGYDKNYYYYFFQNLNGENNCKSNLKDYALVSGKGKFHIMPTHDFHIDWVREWMSGSPVAKRISVIMSNRTQYFNSYQWHNFLLKINKYLTI
tara:strand:+ start:378 stop:911 length:534 start_codon:yes stop_codon:yes gene_type:complete